MKDGRTNPSREEFASGTEQRSKDAAVKDAQIWLRGEECVEGMGQRANDVT